VGRSGPPVDADLDPLGIAHPAADKTNPAFERTLDGGFQGCRYWRRCEFNGADVAAFIPLKAALINPLDQ
jgi:hypothetical protein